jgi:predicted dithiol-disulfide oxidoreductase (DUF899 family)
MALPEIVTRERWLDARTQLLAAEKEATRGRDGGDVFHTYSTYGRGTDILGSAYSLLDLTALGRQEDWEEPKGRAPRLRGADPTFTD